jgi:hypothetical protein
MSSEQDSGHALDAEDRNAMSDSTYAFPAERKEPLNDASHVRNAIARFDQVEGVTDEERREAFQRIQRAAKRFGVEMSATDWRDLGKDKAVQRTQAKRRAGKKSTATATAGPSRDELYAQAQRRNIKGRSSMTKAQLQQALRG